MSVSSAFIPTGGKSCPYPCGAYFKGKSMEADIREHMQAVHGWDGVGPYPQPPVCLLLTQEDIEALLAGADELESVEGGWNEFSIPQQGADNLNAHGKRLRALVVRAREGGDEE